MQLKPLFLLAPFHCLKLVWRRQTAVCLARLCLPCPLAPPTSGNETWMTEYVGLAVERGEGRRMRGRCMQWFCKHIGTWGRMVCHQKGWSHLLLRLDNDIKTASFSTYPNMTIVHLLLPVQYRHLCCSSWHSYVFPTNFGTHPSPLLHFILVQ